MKDHAPLVDIIIIYEYKWMKEKTFSECFLFIYFPYFKSTFSRVQDVKVIFSSNVDLSAVRT